MNTKKRPIRVLVAKVGLDGHDRGAKVSILSGAHMTVFPKIMEAMKAKQLDRVLLTGGGIIPDADMETLSALGVGKLFAPGTSTAAIADYIHEWVNSNRSDLF